MPQTTQPLTELYAHPVAIDASPARIIYLHPDANICQQQGFTAGMPLLVTHRDQQIIATLHFLTDAQQLSTEQLGLCRQSWKKLSLQIGDRINISHPKSLESLSFLRAKVYGHQLSGEQIEEIIQDISKERYSDIDLAAFITACADRQLNDNEIISLTQAMVNVGHKIDWHLPLVLDKHCVGGLPGNRTTPIVISILAACGLTVPKTSSRAITSPAGTADTMESLTRVNLTLEEMKTVVKEQGACLAWGGSVCLSPADDILIRVERALDIDSEGQMIASVLSKKIAAGATHVVIDIPVGETAKVRSQAAAEQLSKCFQTVATALGLQISVMISDGSQPVGRGIGPALEAKDLLQVLQCQADAPKDLRQRALAVAANMLCLAGEKKPQEALQQVTEILDSGAAWQKFQAICRSQGELKAPPTAKYQEAYLASQAGRVTFINNRILSRVAKLAGAPNDPAAGVELLVKLGDTVKEGDTLLCIHSESHGMLQHAIDHISDHPDMIKCTDK